MVLADNVAGSGSMAENIERGVGKTRSSGGGGAEEEKEEKRG